MCIIGRSTAAALLFAAAACGTPTDANPELRIGIRGPATVLSAAAPEQGLICGLQLTASAEGAGGARWQGARFEYRDILTGAVIGAGTWDAPGAQRFWGADRIGAGDVVTSKPGAIGGPYPFVFVATFEFVPDGERAVRTSTHTFTCAAGGA